MDLVLTSFIRALRNAEIRISTAETLDAMRALELVGYGDKALLKNALGLVLPKTVDEKAAFDFTFDQFFASRSTEPLHAPALENEDDRPAGNIEGSESSGGEAAGGAADAPIATPANRRTDTAGSAASSRERAMSENSSDSMVGASSTLGQLLMQGNQLAIGAAINRAGEQIRIHEIEVFTQKGVFTRRILTAMGSEALQEEISGLFEHSDAAKRRLGRELTRRRNWLREQILEYVEHHFLLHADVTGRRLREDLLRNVRLSALDTRHQRMLQEIVLRMARRLIAAHSPRKRIFRRGQLNVARTLRRNMRYDDAIFDLHWKSTRLARPSIFAICDVSGSVANYANFMLMFLYSLEQALPKVRSFAFSSQLVEVSELFARHRIDDAIALTLRSCGGSTDYGQAFSDFRELCLDDVNRRSTIIVLGDGRNNNGDLRSDLLKEIYERCHRLIWLNPEPRSMWNTGDSEMRHISPYCHQVAECSTLAQLQRLVTMLLRAVR